MVLFKKLSLHQIVSHLKISSFLFLKPNPPPLENPPLFSSFIIFPENVHYFHFDPWKFPWTSSVWKDNLIFLENPNFIRIYISQIENLFLSNCSSSCSSPMLTILVQKVLFVFPKNIKPMLICSKNNSLAF